MMEDEISGDPIQAPVAMVTSNPHPSGTPSGDAASQYSSHNPPGCCDVTNCDHTTLLQQPYLSPHPVHVVNTRVNSTQHQRKRTKAGARKNRSKKSDVGVQDSPIDIDVSDDGGVDSEYCQSLLQDAYRYLREGRLVDIHLSCHGHTIPAHRLVLGLSSPVLYSLIVDGSENVTVSLDEFNISASCLDVLVHYMYCGRFPQVRSINDLELLNGARLLGIRKLVVVLENKLKQTKNVIFKDKITVNKKDTAKKKVIKKVKATQKKHLKSVVSEVDSENITKLPGKVDAEDIIGLQNDHELWLPDLDTAAGGENPLLETIPSPMPDSSNDSSPDQQQGVSQKHPDHCATSTFEAVPSPPTFTRLSEPPSPEEATEDVPSVSKVSSPSKSSKSLPAKAKVTKLTTVKTIKHSDGTIECCECGFKASSDRVIYRHRITRHTVGLHHICPQCGKGFKLRKYLSQHLATHLDERPYKCDKCPAAFRTSKHKKRHMLTHSVNKKDASCSLCGETFPSVALCRAHVAAVHKGSSQVKCHLEGCTYSTTDSSQLRKHMMKHGIGEQESVLCEVCGKEFSCSLSLRGHVKSVHGEPTYICTQCPYRGNTKFALISHMGRIHDVGLDGTPVKKNFKCTECKDAFFTRQEVTVHKLKHKGEKPHKCPVCAFATAEKGSLKKHLRLHTGEKPYQCEYCPMKFSHPSGIARHRLQHLGVKPHTCEHCGKSYMKKSSLKAHLYVHTKEKPFECSECSYGCTRRVTMDNHMAKHHSVAENDVSYPSTAVLRTQPVMTSSAAFDHVTELPFSYVISNTNQALSDLGNHGNKQYITMDNLTVAMTQEANQASMALAGHLSPELGEATLEENGDSSTQPLPNQAIYSLPPTMAYSDAVVMTTGSPYLHPVPQVMYNIDPASTSISLAQYRPNQQSPTTPQV